MISDTSVCPPWPTASKARDLVERCAEVVAVADLRGARMQRHAGADRSLLRPPLGAERTLRGKRGLDRTRRGGECGAEGIAAGLEDVSAARLDALPQQGVVRAAAPRSSPRAASPRAGCCLRRPVNRNVTVPLGSAGTVERCLEVIPDFMPVVGDR